MANFILDKLALVYNFLCRLVLSIPAFIYDTIYATQVTRSTYYELAKRLERRTNKPKRILDVGVGTGDPLKQIISRIPQDTQVLGIDIDKNYIRSAKKKFEANKNVTIEYMNFYDLDKRKDEKFDVIIFSSSFMIMPSPEKALEIAREHLTDSGNIYFLMTLYKTKGILERVTGYIKPYLKYITTIEFGQIVYEKDFCDMMRRGGMEITYMDRCLGTFFLKQFRMFIVETVKAARDTSAPVHAQ